MPPIALTIAGSDPSGGAGIQADLKTFHQFGVYGEAVITLVTAQNSHSVLRVEPLAPDLVSEQIEAVISDMPPAAAKTGALGSAEIVEAIADLAARFTFPLVVDPVLISKHQTRLLPKEAEQALKEKLFPCAALVMPNIPEAEALTGIDIHGKEQMLVAARKLFEMGAKAVLVKGGHLEGDPVDVLFDGRAAEYKSPRIDTPHTHGTGCAYSAAITACLALGMPLRDAIPAARRFVQSAIRSAPGLGSGSGPLNFFASTPKSSG
ncbi:MAG TPA: bifunctional hydroxymethylpyrimidine kinase/phosphomethylpyrimidine kinase [Bryobacteraceae bacterium]